MPGSHDESLTASAPRTPPGRGPNGSEEPEGDNRLGGTGPTDAAHAPCTPFPHRGTHLTAELAELNVKLADLSVKLAVLNAELAVRSGCRGSDCPAGATRWWLSRAGHQEVRLSRPFTGSAPPLRPDHRGDVAYCEVRDAVAVQREGDHMPASTVVLEGRVAIVTGGGGGIGGAVSRRLAEAGAHVVLNDIAPELGAATSEAIKSGGGSCTFIEGDIRRDETISRLARTAVAIDGHVDVVVNNVGDFRPASGGFLASTEAQWQQLYETNLLHVFRCTHAFLPGMIDRATGSIVNVSTVEAFRGIPNHAVYSAFNAGVSAFTKSLAVEVGQHGIRVNAIAPDLADTLQTPAAAMLRGRDPALVQTWVPLGRFGQAREYAEVVLFLASDQSSFVTGHTIPVDGGTLAASGWYGRTGGRGWTNMPDQA